MNFEILKHIYFMNFERDVGPGLMDSGALCPIDEWNTNDR